MKFKVKKLKVIQNIIENRAKFMKVLSIESDSKNEMLLTVSDSFSGKKRKARILKNHGYKGALMLAQKSEFNQNQIYVHYVTL